MQVHKIQNNNYNTQFKGTLALLDGDYAIVKKRIPKAADKLLYESFKNLIQKPLKPNTAMIGIVTLNKRDFLEYLGYISIFLGINPKIDESKSNFLYAYDKDADGDTIYQVGLKDYTIEHRLNHKNNYAK